MPRKKSSAKNAPSLANSLSLSGWVAVVAVAVAVAGGSIFAQRSLAAGPPLDSCADSIRGGHSFAVGDNGDCVTAIQYLINSIHARDTAFGEAWYGEPSYLTVGSGFGQHTTTAVEAVQRQAGLAQDGLVGPQTMSYLCQVGGNDGHSSNANLAQLMHNGSLQAKGIFGQGQTSAGAYPLCPPPFGHWGSQL